MNVYEAATEGSERDLLVAMRNRIAEAVADPNCPKRELASLTKRLADIAKEIRALDSQEGGDEIGEAVSVPDAEFDSSAL